MMGIWSIAFTSRTYWDGKWTIDIDISIWTVERNATWILGTILSIDQAQYEHHDRGTAADKDIPNGCGICLADVSCSLFGVGGC